MKPFRLNQTDSTNSYLVERWETLSKPIMIYAVSQTSGRGQRGNSWESEPGKNLTCSYGFIPEKMEAAKQFHISIAVSLAVVDLLSEYHISAKVKWPNDIYYANKKIAGILIENSILGREINRSIAGIGLNINQKNFYSDAPNPVSMAQIKDKEYDIDVIAEKLMRYLEKRLSVFLNPDNNNVAFLNNLEEYRHNLWRGDGGFHLFNDRKRGERIEAKIENVSDEGFLSLNLADGTRRSYIFKEIEFII